MKKKYKYSLYIIGAFIAIFSVLLVIYFTPFCTVVYDTQGGTIYESENLRFLEKATRPQDPVMEGYIFEGWFIKDNEEFNFDSPIKGKTVLKAHWRLP